MIRTTNHNEKGEYRIKITATSTTDPLATNSSVVITVKVISKCQSLVLYSAIPKPALYMIQSDEIILPFPKYTF